jgi:hypothetical protein
MTSEEKKERNRLIQKKYRENNKEKVKERARLAQQKYRENNREKIKSKKKEADKKYREKNKENISKKEKEHYNKNKEAILKRQKIYLEKNKTKIKERVKISGKIYRENNKDKIKTLACEWRKKEPSYFREYRKNRRNNDVLFKLKCSISSSIVSSLKRKGFGKNNRTHEILGCTIEYFKNYLESKFESWMNWDNRGLYNGEVNFGWDLDHIIPIASANTEVGVIELNHYTNFQHYVVKLIVILKKQILLTF